VTLDPAAAAAGTGWLVAVVTLPLAAAVAALLAGRRGGAVVGLLGSLLITVAVFGLTQAVVAAGAQQVLVGGWALPLGIALRADGLAAAMLLLTAVVGSGISVYAWRYYAASRHDADALFWPVWLLLWGALNALYVAGDVFNLYVSLELLGLAAVALIALAGAGAVAAALRYLLALLGSMLYLLGVVLLYAEFGTLDLLQLQAAMHPGLAPALAAALMTVGLMVKTAVFPLHFWLPSAHAGAPAPVSAALSGLVIKAGFYLLLRLWLELYAALPAAVVVQTLLAALGALAVLWGGVQALRQVRLKPMIAYSTVAQIGYLMLALPLAASAPAALPAVVLLAASHAAAKAAMFFCAGTLLAAYGHDRIAALRGFATQLPVVAAAFALAAISLVGLPLSGGFVGKFLLVEVAVGAGAWWIVVVVLVGSLLAAAYLFRVLVPAFGSAVASDAERAAAVGLPQYAALGLALMSIALGLGGPGAQALLAVTLAGGAP
jgi:formate hydrogenlyase subunit 3/multisubunit Na+/H+ antiporter MnhD subunit